MKRIGILIAVAATIVATAGVAHAQTTYRVTVTNLTPGQIMSPPIVATHRLGMNLFTVGREASPALAAVAEDADGAMMMDMLAASDRVHDFGMGGGVIMPGQSRTVTVEARPPYHRLSVVGMLVTTNDAFYGLDGMIITGPPWMKSIQVPAYDAGSEANDESCDSIPGPPCMNPFVRVTDGAEGFVHVHPGIQGSGDLDPATWDWKNPVAKITVIETN